MFVQNSPEVKSRVGVVGSGFIAMGLCTALRASRDLTVSRVLTRRPLDQFKGAEQMTDSVEELLAHSDIIVECSGDIVWACEVVQAAQAAQLPVVTMATEFHVTVGTYFVDRGIITEAEGDQPGSLAALREEALEMGFSPVVYGNIKGFLNHHPSELEMQHWSKRHGISQPQVTSFTDGTKLQLEQALVANGLGGRVARQGLIGPRDLSLEDAGGILAREAKALNVILSDYVINRTLPAGVFVVAEHPTERPEVLRYLKLGDGPFYTLLRPYHLCHLEVPRTIRRILHGGPPLLNNGTTPTCHVIAIAKRDLPAGSVITRAIGGMEVRGEADSIANSPDAAPLGLLAGARLRHGVERGQKLLLSDVDIPDNLAKTAWESVHARLSAVG